MPAKQKENALSGKGNRSLLILKLLIKSNRIDPSAFDFATEFNTVWFFEEGIKTGSVARNFGDALLARQFNGRYHIKTIGDKFVKQMSVSEALHMLKLDAEGMADVVLEDLEKDWKQIMKKKT